MQNEELLDDFNFSPEEEGEIQLAPASVGKRLLNYLIDSMVVRALMYLFTLLISNPDFMAGVDSLGLIFLMLFLIFGILFGYFWIGEHLLGGRTIGKLITGTRVVDDYDGSRPTGTSILLRTLSRAVPFEPFSIFFNEDRQMWHDKWSGTMVVDIKKSVLPDA